MDNPVTVATSATSQGLDKPWIVCDNVSSSFKGNCYIEWDDHAQNNLIEMSTSSLGGIKDSWSTQKTPNHGIGGQPLVLPNGNVVVPFNENLTSNNNAVLMFTSTNSGWSSYTVIQSITAHSQAGHLRSDPLISAGIDGAGNVYIFWQDCRFVSNCAANTIVYVVLTSGTLSPSSVMRLPTNVPSSSTLADYFIPDVAIDKSTSGSTAHLAVTYYYYPNTNCTFSGCRLYLNFTSSTNGGQNWSSPIQLAGPMQLAWLPNTFSGRMVGDYISTSFSNAGVAFPIFVKAQVPIVGTDCSAVGAVCNEAIYSVTSGLS